MIVLTNENNHKLPYFRKGGIKVTFLQYILEKKTQRAEDYYNTFNDDSIENSPFELVRSTKFKYFKDLFTPIDHDKGKKTGYIKKLAPIK